MRWAEMVCKKMGMGTCRVYQEFGVGVYRVGMGYDWQGVRSIDGCIRRTEECGIVSTQSFPVFAMWDIW